jgi:hypothetical protein
MPEIVNNLNKIGDEMAVSSPWLISKYFYLRDITQSYG